MQRTSSSVQELQFCLKVRSVCIVVANQIALCSLYHHTTRHYYDFASFVLDLFDTNDRCIYLSHYSTTTAKPLKMSDTALKFGPEW